MANVNKIVRRRQLALFIALVLGIGAGGAGTWMVSEMNLKKAPPAKAPKGEPAPDMTGVVNQSFDNKVQRSAIAEAQRLNKETQAEIKKLRTEMGIIGRDLKGSQERIRELEDENKLLQTQIEAGKNFDSLSAEPLPGALASQGKPAAQAGDIPPPTTFWPAGGGQAPAAPVMTPVQRPGMMDSQEFTLPDIAPEKPRFPWISSGSFAEAIVVEGADANASVTGDKNTVPMQLRLTG
ncbi:TPA: conjugal transfer protein TraB, partial [Escherichia coli]|nr:conjugal transfer protein TraB [Escherichia coli]